MSKDIPRDPSHYRPSVHAVQRKKDRGIDWELISDTIATGKVRETHIEDKYLFSKYYEGMDKPIGVVAHAINGTIMTVEFRDGEQDRHDREPRP